MPIDDRTTNRNYQKPAAANLLSDDVVRLRAALDAIDADVAARATTAALDAAITALRGSPPGALDTLDKLANAIADDANFAGSMVTALAGKVPTTRQVATGAGLEGGGALSADRTLSLTAAVLASLALADTAVQPARTVFTGTGLQGGGDLASNRTISLTAAVLASLALADSALQPGAIATQAEAEAGTSASKLLSAQGGAWQVDALAKPIKQRVVSSPGNLQLSDQGGHVFSSANVTVPQNVFAVGHAIVIVNSTASPITITQGSGVTLRLAGSASTGSRQVDAYGMATVICVSSNTFYVSGPATT